MSNSWNMKPNTGGGEWEMPPAGNMSAVCIAFIDLGTQQDAFQGKPREVRQVAIVWELAGELNSKTNKNHVVTAKYTASLHEKAALRKIIESWGGRKIKEDEEFDFFKLVGAPCLLQVSHGKSSGGSDIYSIDAVATLPRGTSKPAPTFPLIKYHTSDGLSASPKEEWLPHLYGKKISEIIAQSVEFRPSGGTNRPKNSEAGTQPAGQAARGQAPLEPPPSQDDDVPF